MSKFGLGRGLADLKEEMGIIPDISVLTSSERTIIRQIPLNQIGVNTNQPRKSFSQEEMMSLASSIKEKGVLQPILLRTVHNKPYLYEIIAGERRYRASKIAGLNEIPALIKTLSDENAIEIALIENIQREDLNSIDEAEAYENLVKNCGYKISDISRIIGKSSSYVKNSIRLNNLPDSVKLLIKQKQLSASHARTIATAKNPEKLAQEIIKNKMSVAETGEKMKNLPRSEKKYIRISNALDPETVDSIESRLKFVLRVPVKLREKRGGAGQIILSFSTRLQMGELIKKLLKKL